MADTDLFHQQLATYVLVNFLSRETPGERASGKTSGRPMMAPGSMATESFRQSIRNILDNKKVGAGELRVYLMDMLSDEASTTQLRKMGFNTKSRYFAECLQSLLEGKLAPDDAFAGVLADALHIRPIDRTHFLHAARQAESKARQQNGAHGVIHLTEGSDSLEVSEASQVDILRRAERARQKAGIEIDSIKYWENCIPDPSRKFVPLSDLLQSQGLGLLKEDTEKFKQKITSLLAADHRSITLDDGHITTLDKVFFWAASQPNGAGRQTFYCDSQSGAFLLAETGIYPTLPQEKMDAKWVTARIMNDRLGRKSYGYLSQEVHDFLLATRQKPEIDIGETRRNPAEMIGLYRSPSQTRVSEGGMGYSVYCDPAIEPYLRENLVCNLTEDKQHWYNANAILAHLHLKQDFANRYSVTEILKQLHKEDAKLTYRNAQEQMITRRTRQCLGRFGVRGNAEMWMADPDIAGQVITADLVRNKKAMILADDQQRAEMHASQEENRRTITPADDTPKRPFGQMLEEYVAGGGTDFVALLEAYETEHSLTHVQMAMLLDITESTWRIWRERTVKTSINPASMEAIASRFELTPSQNLLLRQLIANTAGEEISPLATLIADTKKQLKAISWQDRDKRAKIAGSFFDQLLGNYPVQWLAKDAGLTVNTIRAWRTELNPEKQALEKADIIAQNPKLVPDSKMAPQVADLLLGLPKRNTPAALLKMLDNKQCTLGEVLLQKRLENREGTNECGGRLSAKGSSNRASVSRLEHNSCDHVSIPIAKSMADYIGYSDLAQRFRFIRHAMGLKQQRNPGDLLKEFLARDTAITGQADKYALLCEYIKIFIENQQLKTPLLLEMLNAQLPPERQVTPGGARYWTENRPERKLPPGIYRDVMEEMMDIIGLEGEEDRRLFIQHFAIDRPTRGPGRSSVGEWTNEYLSGQAQAEQKHL